MKKRGIGLFAVLAFVVFGFSFVSGAVCNLDAQLLNQDPYPALPGDYVKVVFQITGIDNPECGDVEFELVKEFPFSLDKGAVNKIKVRGGTFKANFASYLLAPYKIRVDENALEGDNEIRVKFSHTGDIENFFEEERFSINVEDMRTDFEVSVKEFDSDSHTITFEILNIGESNVEALTVEILKQENIEIKGANRNIVGDLDSNEDSTFTFEAVPRDGEIEMIVFYTDGIGVRRELGKRVIYDSSYFTNRKGDEIVPKPTSFYLLIGLVILVIIVWIRGRIKRKRKMKAEREKLRRKK